MIWKWSKRNQFEEAAKDNQPKLLEVFWWRSVTSGRDQKDTSKFEIKKWYLPWRREIEVGKTIVRYRNRVKEGVSDRINYNDNIRRFQNIVRACKLQLHLQVIKTKPPPQHIRTPFLPHKMKTSGHPSWVQYFNHLRFLKLISLKDG